MYVKGYIILTIFVGFSRMRFRCDHKHCLLYEHQDESVQMANVTFNMYRVLNWFILGKFGLSLKQKTFHKKRKIEKKIFGIKYFDRFCQWILFTHQNDF